MANKDREIKRLRREVEVLRAQLKTEQKGTSNGEGNRKTQPETTTKKGNTKDYQYVKKDLKRSLLIATGIFAAILGLKFSQPYWSQVTTTIFGFLPI
ncbi:MAG: hypothetical protein ACOC6Q_00240 [Patescibacteria group bacterium]